jgi:hypothetical protein
MKFSLIERQQQTLKAYTDGELRAHFLSKDFIDGVSDQRNNVYARQAKAAGNLFVVTTLLAFFDYLTGQTISAFGFEIHVEQFYASILCFIVAASFFATISATLDVLLVDAYLRAIGESVGLYSFEIYTLPKTALNLWSGAFTPKYFGPKSGRGHHVALWLLAVGMIGLSSVFALYPLAVCGTVVFAVLESGSASLQEKALVVAATVMLIVSCLFLGLFFLKYRFMDADFHEKDNSITKEFADRLQRENSTVDK